MKKRIKKVVHHLRKQPEEDRRHLLHLTTFVFAVLLVVIWSYSLGQSISASDTKEKMSRDVQPFSDLKDRLVDDYNTVSAQDPETTE